MYYTVKTSYIIRIDILNMTPWANHMYPEVNAQQKMSTLIKQDSTKDTRQPRKLNWVNHMYPEVNAQQKMSTLIKQDSTKDTRQPRKLNWVNHMYPGVAKQLGMGLLSLHSSPPDWPPMLYRHQREGIKWLLDRENAKIFPGGLLCDEPGLGKTIQMGACMSENPLQNTLLILPNAVIQQWHDTLKKMLPRAHIYIHHGKTKLTNSDILSKNAMNIVIVTIAGIVNPALRLKKHKKKTTRNIRRTYAMKVFSHITWDRIIMDECHYIKNKGSLRARSSAFLQGGIKWGLTGTPVQNSIDDLVSLCTFIKPDKWNEQKYPINKYTIQYYKKRLMLRRTKDNCPVDSKHPLQISKITETSVPFPFSTQAERKLYATTIRYIEKQIEKTMADDSESNIGKFQCMLELLLRARQLSIHPRVYREGIKRRASRLNTVYVPCSTEEEEYDYTRLSSRYETVLRYIEQAPKTNQLLFCRYTAEMDLWERVLTEKGIRCCKYNGSTSMSDREIIINSFTTDNPGGVLLIQIMAGGVGLNLQQFTRVLLTTPDWNPSNEIQAIARSHRIGQSIQVDVFRFILDDSELLVGDKAAIIAQQPNTAKRMNDVITKKRKFNASASIDVNIMAVQVEKHNIMETLLEDDLSNVKCRLTFQDIQSIISSN
jgi:SNF2 family DNA or RNA helicase